MTGTPQDPFVSAAIAAACAFAAWRSTRGARGSSGAVRLAPAFLVAAAALPSPAIALAGLAAVLAGRGAGLASWGATPSPRGAIAEIAGVAAAQALARFAGGVPVAVAALGTYAALAGATAAADALLSAPRARAASSRALFEAVGAEAGILLAEALRSGTGLAALLGTLVGGSLVLAANEGTARLAAARESLDIKEARLSARDVALSAVHAVSREILATTDQRTILAIVERECRKSLSFDVFFIGLVDKDTGALSSSHRVTAAETAPGRATRGDEDLASWVVREKRSLRIDDATARVAPPPIRPWTLEPSTRSVLAAPLLVDDRVRGVVSVRSSVAAAYDDASLSFLETIAQQAALAVAHADPDRSGRSDPLTGLAPREAFVGRLAEEHVRARRYGGAFSVLMLDLDGFKDLNDRWGRAAGDRYLREAAYAIRSRLRGADLACRYDGDAFCALLLEADPSGARPVAERIRSAVASLIVDAEGGTVRTTISIGIATFPDHDLGHPGSLLLRAEQALQRAKRGGRDRVTSFAA